MSRKQPKIQLELPLPDAKGEARNEPTERVELPMVEREPESPAATGRLMEQVATEGNLLQAWKRVRANKGRPGIDGMTVEDLDLWMGDNIRIYPWMLTQGEYEPEPVFRVEIPKPCGGRRKLGIPTVVDRVVQQALLQHLQPLFEPTFSEHSYGFRPGRSAHQAVAQAQHYVQEGHTWVVDLDLEKFFDRVNHDRLTARVAREVKDKRALKLIRAFLNAGVMEDGLVKPTDEGTPQGGPLTPFTQKVTSAILLAGWPVYGYGVLDIDRV